MTGKTHAIVGANAIWVAPFLGVTGWEVLPLVFVGIVGGLFPDVDAKESEIHDETFNVTKLLMAHKLFGHRRFFHSFLATGLAGWTIGRFVPPVIPAIAPVFALGYLSHLVIDGFNTKGVVYLWPINWSINWVPDFLQSPCGGWMDDLLFVVGAMGLGAFAYAHGTSVLQSVLSLL